MLGKQIPVACLAPDFGGGQLSGPKLHPLWTPSCECTIYPLTSTPPASTQAGEELSRKAGV